MPVNILTVTIIRKSTFSKKVTVNKVKFPLHTQSENPACASKRGVLVLETLQYSERISSHCVTEKTDPICIRPIFSMKAI